MNTILQKRIEEAGREHYAKSYSPFADPYEESKEFENDCYCFKEGATFALQNQWISVEEDLPPYDKAVIGMDYMPELDWDDQTIIFVHRSDNPNVVTDKNKFCVYPPSFCKVTHWMEIPSLEGGEE